MGTWGVGALENDAAADWAAGLEGTEAREYVAKAIDRIAHADPGEHLDLDDSIAAVAAAEIIAAARGQESSQLSDKLRQWITEQSFMPQQGLTKAAAAAVTRIRDASELRDEWSDGQEWLAEMDRLCKRLMHPVPSSPSAARPGKRKKVVQK